MLYLKNLRYIAILLFAVVLVIGCAGTRPPVDGDREQISGGDSPDWVYNPSEESNDDNKAFVGVSQQYAMEQQARSDAERDAFERALMSMGAFGKILVERALSQAGVSTTIVNPGVAENRLSEWRARGAVLGDLTEWHIENWKLFEGGRWRHFYVANCLFLMPRDAARRFAEEVLRQQAEAAQAQEERENLQRALEQMDRLQTDDW